jgi:hypothetical protein
MTCCTQDTIGLALHRVNAMQGCLEKAHMHLHQCEMLQACQLPPQTIPQPAPPSLPCMSLCAALPVASGSKGLAAGIQQTDEPIYNMIFQPLICCLLHLVRALRSPTTSDPILSSAPPQPIVVDDMLHPGHHWIGAAQGKRDARMPREGPHALASM